MQHNRGQTCSRNEFLIRVDSQQRHAKGEMPFNHYISDCWFSTMKIHVSFCAASSRGSRPKYESDLSSFINSRLHSSSLPAPTFRIVYHSFCIMMPNQYLQTSFRFHIDIQLIWRMRPNWKSVPSSNMNLDFESIEWFSNFIAAHKLYFIRKSMYVDVMWNVIGCRSQIFYRRTWQHRFKSLIIRSICSEWYQKHITYNYESSPSANMHTRHLIASADSTSRAHSRSALFHRIPFKLSMRNFSVFVRRQKLNYDEVEGK